MMSGGTQYAGILFTDPLPVGLYLVVADELVEVCGKVSEVAVSLKFRSEVERVLR